MDVDEIGAILSRASEIRWKINGCIERATSQRKSSEDVGLRLLGEEVGEEDEAEGLLSIRDALESLEQQLGSLQILQQQQRYEIEATLAEIDQSRRILLRRLKEYKGDDLEVIREATIFMGEAVESDDDLLLPPYPSQAPTSLVMDKNYLSCLVSAPDKSARNGTEVSIPFAAISKQQEAQTSGQSSCPSGINFLGMAGKMFFTIVSVVSALSLAGVGLKLERSTHSKAQSLFLKPVIEKAGGIQCPPGKVLVNDDGKLRCLVKERVELPFKPVVGTPDISYGYG